MNINECPICKKSNYVKEEPHITSEQIYQDCYCPNCNTFWTNYYIFKEQLIEEVRTT
jgi:hypothetical protein